MTGKSNNPGGKTAGQTRVLRRFEALSEKAIRTLERNMDCGTPAVEVKAAETVIAYAVGKPKQQTEVSVSATPAAAAHLSALRTMAEMVQLRHPVIEHNPLISLANLTSDDKHLIKHDDVVDVETVTLEPDNPIEPMT